MAAVFTLDAGKSMLQVATVEITVDHLFDIWPPECVLSGIMLFIDARLKALLSFRMA